MKASEGEKPMARKLRVSRKRLSCVSLGALALGFAAAHPAAARADSPNNGLVERALLISIDGMHALDFANCANGIAGLNEGKPYCPNLAGLSQHGTTFTQTSTRPSDSFPGLTALVTGGSPRSTGAFYDVSYDRSLSPPAKTTPYGIVGGPELCPSVIGTQVGFDEEIDYRESWSIADRSEPGSAHSGGQFLGPAPFNDPQQLVRDARWCRRLKTISR